MAHLAIIDYFRIVIGINCFVYARIFSRLSDKDTSAGAFGSAQLWMGLWMIFLVLQKCVVGTVYYQSFHACMLIATEISAYTAFRFSYRYSLVKEGRDKWWIYLPLLFPVVMSGVALIRGPSIFSSGGQVMTVWDYLHAVYGYTLIGTAVVLLLTVSVFRQPERRKGYLFITGTVLIFVIHNVILYLRDDFGYTSIPAVFDILYLLCIFIMVNLTTWGLFLNGKEQIVYYSKHTLFEKVGVPLFAFSQKNEFIIANESAKQFMAENGITVRKHASYADIFPSTDFKKLGIPQDREGRSTFYISVPGKNLMFQCNKIVLFNYFHQPVGYVIAFYDLNMYDLLIQNLEDNAYSDILTGCLNRSAFQTNLSDTVKKTKNALLLVVAGLDDLARINGKLGHEYGDEYLQAAVEVLRSANSGRPVYRIESSTFSFFVEAKDQTVIQNMMEEMLKEVRADSARKSKERKIPLVISVGYTVLADRNVDVHSGYLLALSNMLIDRKSHSPARLSET